MQWVTKQAALRPGRGWRGGWRKTWLPALEHHLAVAHNLNIAEANVERAVGIGRMVREMAAHKGGGQSRAGDTDARWEANIISLQKA